MVIRQGWPAWSQLLWSYPVAGCSTKPQRSRSYLSLGSIYGFSSRFHETRRHPLERFHQYMVGQADRAKPVWPAWPGSERMAPGHNLGRSLK